jgi:PPK2 family polyphosphate:nucleotide phosphotransferase
MSHVRSLDPSASTDPKEPAMPERRLRDQLRVEPGRKVHLDRIDPAGTHGFNRAGATKKMADDLARLTGLQDRLWAEARHPVLVVLQGIDAAGKDGTVSHVMSAFNPQGCLVANFKVPSPVEMAHDYLWRVHQRTPAKGEIAIFNRSHYEDVLVVRVHGLVPRSTWRRRYAQINDWERTLVEEGTTVVKFFLLIDRDEQRRRFEDRLHDPTKRWKFKMGDLAERARWDDYTAAFEEALSRCSTEAAPWYLIPANKNWFRNLAVAEILGDLLEGLKPAYPAIDPSVPADLVIS